MFAQVYHLIIACQGTKCCDVYCGSHVTLPPVDDASVHLT